MSFTSKLFRPLADLYVIKLGGQSIIDRGAEGVQPLVEEIVRVRADYPLQITAGGGTRIFKPE